MHIQVSMGSQSKDNEVDLHGDGATLVSYAAVAFAHELNTNIIRNELREAGFANITYETHRTESIAPSPRHVAIALCQGTPQRIEIEAWDTDLLDEVTDRVEKTVASRFGQGPVSARIEGHVIAAAR